MDTYSSFLIKTVAKPTSDFVFGVIDVNGGGVVRGVLCVFSDRFRDEAVFVNASVLEIFPMVHIFKFDGS